MAANITAANLTAAHNIAVANNMAVARNIANTTVTPMVDTACQMKKFVYSSRAVVALTKGVIMTKKTEKVIQ